MNANAEHSEFIVLDRIQAQSRNKPIIPVPVPTQQEAAVLGGRIYQVTDGIQSKYSQVIYAGNFKRFLDHIKIQDLQVLLDFSPKVIKQVIIDYILYLREWGIKLGSIKTQVAAIIHFFQINIDDFNLKMNNFRLHLPPGESINEDRPYTTQEIIQVLAQGSPDLRTKVAVLLLCSSGIRMGDLHSLQIGDLTKIEQFNLRLYKVQIYARTRDRYYTFCTPECAAAIYAYLNYRRRFGEQLADKSPLLRKQFNPDNPFTINVPLSVSSVSENGIEYIESRFKAGWCQKAQRDTHDSWIPQIFQDSM